MENLEKELKVVQEMKAVTEGAFENADCDYPAAHSMDTTWFAVDRDGFVAMLVTNEEGALPLASQEDQGDGMEFLEDLSAHTGRELQLGDYEFPLPESLGLFGYEWPLGEFPEGCELSEDELCDMQESDGLPSPYKRSAVPTAPLKIDDLPPNLQKKLKGLVFSEVSFAAEDFLAFDVRKAEGLGEGAGEVGLGQGLLGLFSDVVFNVFGDFTDVRRGFAKDFPEDVVPGEVLLADVFI